MRRHGLLQLLRLGDITTIPHTYSTSGRALYALAAEAATISNETEIPWYKRRKGDPQDDEVPFDTLIAHLRQDSGSRFASRLRKTGTVPGLLFSIMNEGSSTFKPKGEGDSILLTFKHNEILRRLNKTGRTGWACQVFNVEVREENEDGTGNVLARYRALGRQVHKTAANGAIENVTLIHCPAERIVKVDVPLTVYGQELSPGLKAGGRINWIERTIACIAQGDCVPREFEVSVAQLEIGQKLYYKDLEIPKGVKLAVKDDSLPIMKIMRK